MPGAGPAVAAIEPIAPAKIERELTRTRGSDAARRSPWRPVHHRSSGPRRKPEREVAPARRRCRAANLPQTAPSRERAPPAPATNGTSARDTRVTGTEAPTPADTDAAAPRLSAAAPVPAAPAAPAPASAAPTHRRRCERGSAPSRRHRNVEDEIFRRHGVPDADEDASGPARRHVGRCRDRACDTRVDAHAEHDRDYERRRRLARCLNPGHSAAA